MLKIMLYLSLSIVLLMAIIVKTTEYLQDKPKTNKFRQWWSNNIVDLDNRYSD